MDLQVHAFVASMMTALRKHMGVSIQLTKQDMAPLSRLKYLLGSGPEWMADLVRHLVNMNLWPQTRSVSLSG